MRRILCGALCVMLFCVLVSSFRAEAQSPRAGAFVICDTAEQAIMFGSLFEEKGAKGAADAVNEDAKNPDACGMYHVHFIRGDEKGVVIIGGIPHTVIEILVIGVRTEQGWQMVPPTVQYAVEAAEGRPA